MLKIFVAFTLLTMGSGNVRGQKNEKPIDVLIVDGFSNHDWKQTTKLIQKILDETGRFKVDVTTIPADSVSRQTWYYSFKKYAVIIQNTNNINDLSLRWPEKMEKQLETFVKNGGGLYILHSANNAFPHWDEYEKMIGLGWRSKNVGYALEVDAGNNIIRIPPGEGQNTGHGKRFNALITILNRHPINSGYPAQWLTADMEVYNFPRGKAENITVLSYTYDSSATQRNWPVEWIVRYGKGNVYNSSMGHLWKGDNYPLSYRCIGFQTTVIRVTEWLATGKIRHAVPTGFPDNKKISLRSEAYFKD